ncbi:hypothetical protein BH23GEM9_BH23GEM9_32810 [soil metagenome]
MKPKHVARIGRAPFAAYYIVPSAPEHHRPGAEAQFPQGRRVSSLHRLRDDEWPQIAGRLRRDKLLAINHETIYRYIWYDKRLGGSLYLLLRGSRKKKWKRYRSYDSRGRMRGKRLISERPAGAKNRLRVGHLRGGHGGRRLRPALHPDAGGPEDRLPHDRQALRSYNGGDEPPGRFSRPRSSMKSRPLTRQRCTSKLTLIHSTGLASADDKNATGRVLAVELHAVRRLLWADAAALDLGDGIVLAANGLTG